MKTLLFSILLAMRAFAAAPETPLAVAVFDFQTPTAALAEKTASISALLGAQLATDARLVMVERTELAKVMAEQELGLAGAVAETSAAKVGELTGARLLITGRLLKLDRDTILIGKLIGTETSRVFVEKITMPPSEGLEAGTEKLAKKLAVSAVENREALLGKSDDPSGLVDQLKKKLEGKALPTISVSIPEQHFGRPVIDPAAETELSFLLRQCGFQVVDAKSDTKPEVEITGEAFSELGWQRGNLIACKARLEIKARRVADGALLAVDRQTGVAIDLGEHIAAKAALQNAARTVAGRLVPLSVP